MDVRDFDYELPEELIAQDPLQKRDDSRLMILDKETGEIRCIGESSHCFIDSKSYQLVSLKRSHPEIHKILLTMVDQQSGRA